MKVRLLLAASAVVLVTQTPWSAQAFECPKHFTAAQVAIDKVAADIEADIPWKRTEDKGLVRALLDDAKSRLASAKLSHENSLDAYDHARAIAQADSALGYAKATDIFHLHLMAN